MLSVVIPTLNAAATLGACLERLQGADEIVVCDGGSSDATLEIAERSGARVLCAERGRGVQLRAGAEAAGGDWLLFLHADTLVGLEWHAAASRHAAVAPHAAAAFALRLAHPAWQARLIERAVGVRSRLFGLPYGDQGLLVPRALYDEVGGYMPLPLMEDVDLVRRIGRRRLRLLTEEATTSAVRWQRDGWVRRSVRNLLVLGLWRFGVGEARLAHLYR